MFIVVYWGKWYFINRGCILGIEKWGFGFWVNVFFVFYLVYRLFKKKKILYDVFV